MFAKLAWELNALMNSMSVWKDNEVAPEPLFHAFNTDITAWHVANWLWQYSPELRAKSSPPPVQLETGPSRHLTRRKCSSEVVTGWLEIFRQSASTRHTQMRYSRYSCVTARRSSYAISSH